MFVPFHYYPFHFFSIAFQWILEGKQWRLKAIQRPEKIACRKMMVLILMDQTSNSSTFWKAINESFSWTTQCIFRLQRNCGDILFWNDPSSSILQTTQSFGIRTFYVFLVCLGLVVSSVVHKPRIAASCSSTLWEYWKLLLKARISNILLLDLKVHRLFKNFYEYPFVNFSLCFFTRPSDFLVGM